MVKFGGSGPEQRFFFGAALARKVKFPWPQMKKSPSRKWKSLSRKVKDLRRDVPDFVAGSAPDLPLLPKEKRKQEKKIAQKKKAKQGANSKGNGKKRKIPLPDAQNKRQRNS